MLWNYPKKRTNPTEEEEKQKDERAREGPR